MRRLPFRSALEFLHTTRNEYWHIHLSEDKAGSISLVLPKKKSSLALSGYAIPLKYGSGELISGYN
jgi:hypothetical protein